MRAVQVIENGGPEVLALGETAVPEPKTGEVRIKVEAAGINYIDTYQRKGLYPLPLPFTLGKEVAGVIDALGEGVTQFAIGNRVAFGMGSGGYADYTTAGASTLVPVPAGVTSQQAAAVMLQGMTAHYLVHDTFALKEGDVALVHAAAGGVGLLLVQMAKMRGAAVIGTVSTQEKADLATAAGADHIIRYTEQDFAEETLRLTNGRGVDVVYDSVGKTTFDKSLTVLRPRGLLALYGQSSGPVADFNPQRLNAGGSLFLTRPSLGHYIATREELLRRSGDIFSWMADGKLKVRIDRTFGLEEAADAHRYIEGRKTKGKILLVP